MLWFCLLFAIVAGVWSYGRKSIRFVRGGDFDQANRALFRSGLVAAACGMGAASLTLGWPWMRVSSSVPEEVSRTVVDTIVVPVKVTRWIFFRGEEKKTVEVSRQETETIWRTQESVRFNLFLIVPLAFVGFVCFLLETWAVRVIWRRIG